MRFPRRMSAKYRVYLPPPLSVVLVHARMHRYTEELSEYTRRFSRTSIVRRADDTIHARSARVRTTPFFLALFTHDRL